MKEGFEDAFMDIQSDYISLCLEFAGSVEKVYAYLYQSPQVRMFNAFYLVGGAIKPAGEIPTDVDVDEFMQVGRDDVDRLLAVCEEYGHAAPHELRMVYDVETGHYDATYGYEDYAVKRKTSCTQEFMDWFRAERAAHVSSAS